jgi:Sulfotransferase family
LPIFKNRTSLELKGGIRLFLNLEAGLVGIGAVVSWFRSRLGTKVAVLEPTERSAAKKPSSTRNERATHVQQTEPIRQKQEFARVRQQLALRDQEVPNLRAKLEKSDASVGTGGIRPEDIIWIFGHGRTGSTWLASMMGEHHAIWHEPYVGEIFGSAYYLRSWDWQRKRDSYILGSPYKEIWLKSIRSFVLDGAKARFSEVVGKGYLVIKEPHGSIGAPLLMEALPESRMVLLVRDPRDVAASRLDAHRREGWASKVTNKSGDTLADTDPNAFIAAIINEYRQNIEKARQAYDAHPETRRVMIKYEELREDTFEELKRIYAGLDVVVDEGQLRRVAEKHAWENIPEEEKGQGNFYRKATPGSWKEDLTPEQAKVVEEITAPLLREFYT